MSIKLATKTLSNVSLAYALAIAEGFQDKVRVSYGQVFIKDCDDWIAYDPGTDWSVGGPILEREGLSPSPQMDSDCIITGWETSNWKGSNEFVEGLTVLESGLRSHLVFRLGTYVMVPEALVSQEHENACPSPVERPS